MFTYFPQNGSRNSFFTSSLNPLLRHFDELWDENEKQGSFAPPVEVHELENHYVLNFDVPGIAKDQIAIEIEGNELRVAGERKSTREQKDGAKTFFTETRYGKFERRFRLPEGVSADSVEAQYENGVLTVAVQKPEVAKRRKVEITTGEGSKEGFFKKLGFGKEKTSETHLRAAN